MRLVNSKKILIELDKKELEEILYFINSAELRYREKDQEERFTGWYQKLTKASDMWMKLYIILNEVGE